MQSFVYTLLICSATMSAISILFMLFSPLLSKRYSAKWQYYAWLVIIVGFIVPFRPYFSFGIFTVTVPDSLVQENISNTPVQEDISNRKANVNIPEKDKTELFVRDNITDVPLTDTPSIADIVEEKSSGERETAITTNISDNPNTLQNNISPVHTYTIGSIYEIIFLIWIIGAVLVLGYNLFRHYRLTRMMNRWKEDITDTRTLDILQRQKESLNIKKNISVQRCQLITGSMLAGLMNPIIMMQTTKYSEEELCFIIRHELIHFKRKDLFFKILVLIAKAIHWFNPIVYLVDKAISAQCEKACDDAVIGNADPVVRTKYALFIADIAKTRSSFQTALTTNFYGGKYNMKNRLLSIIDKSTKRKGIILICLALVLTICTSLVLAANTTEKSILNGSSALDEIETTQTGLMNDEQENTNPKAGVYTPEEIEALSTDLENSIKPYAHLGVRVDTAAGLMMYEGHPVREIMDWNPVTEILTGITDSLGPNGFGGRIVYDAVDLTTVYENDVLIGLRKSTQEEYDMHTEERRRWVSENSNLNADNTAESYEELMEKIYDVPFLVEKTYANISDIMLNLTDDNVVVLRGGNSVKIKYYQWIDNEYTLSDDGKGSLTLEYNGWNLVDSMVSCSGRQVNPENPNADKRTVEITVPENVTLQNLIIGVITGNITINENSDKTFPLTIKKIKAITTNGNISINDCSSGEKYTALCSQNGSVNIQNCNAVKLNANTVNGDVSINDCTNGQDYTALCEIGNVTVKNCGTEIIKTTTANGDIVISDCTNGQNYTAVCRQNGFVTVNNCTVESVLVSAVIGQINIQDSKINTATLERNIGSDMTLPANTVIDPVTIKNSTINFASATMPDGDIYVQDSNVPTLKINNETYNSVQNVTFKISEGIVQTAQ